MRPALLGAVVLLLATAGQAKSPQGTAPKAAKQSAPHSIAEFNLRFTEAIRHMDNDAVMALWADDGVTLLPETKPIVGKPAIAKFLAEATSKTSGYKVLAHENDFRDIRESGRWASEWALTTQTVQPPDGKPAFTIHGKILLVLHRGSDSVWRIQTESWTSAPAQ